MNARLYSFARITAPPSPPSSLRVFLFYFVLVANVESQTRGILLVAENHGLWNTVVAYWCTAAAKTGEANRREHGRW